MPLDLVTVPCKSDNYAFLLHDGGSGASALVDAPETVPIVAALEARRWNLAEIWITHHHGDHVEAVEDLRVRYGCSVTGSGADAARLPPLDRKVVDGDSFEFAGHEVHVLDVSGHTVGHIAFHVPDACAVFTADSLMALGCGRLFEGTAPQMWTSLRKIAALPGETLVCSGHEYTLNNGKFALTIEPDNEVLAARVRAVEAARAEGRPTVPSRLDEELATNPFLRAGLPEVKFAVGLEGYSDSDVFAEIRRRKDSF